MNKQWSILNKEFKMLLNKKETFKDGINKLIELRNILFNEWRTSMSGIYNNIYFEQPFLNKDGYESKTIIYSIYHVVRIEDVVLNTLIKKEDQIFFKNNYQEKMNSKIITTGNELKGESISLFSKELIIEEVWNYAQNVFEKTNEWLLSIDYKDLKTVYNESDKTRIKNTNTVCKSEEWLIDYWCNKDIKGLINMPFSRHWIMHIEASFRIMNKLNKNSLT